MGKFVELGERQHFFVNAAQITAIGVGGVGPDAHVGIRTPERIWSFHRADIRGEQAATVAIKALLSELGKVHNSGAQIITYLNGAVQSRYL
ncbi:hypothetical protein PJM49_26480 [Mycobacterium kansasii]